MDPNKLADKRDVRDIKDCIEYSSAGCAPIILLCIILFYTCSVNEKVNKLETENCKEINNVQSKNK